MRQFVLRSWRAALPYAGDHANGFHGNSTSRRMRPQR
jgi:hypothetical protein